MRIYDITPDISERLDRYTEKTETCWLWSASLDGNGYGIISRIVNGKPTSLRAHRYSYIREFGALPKGALLDHVCHTRACVNPDHLEPVTARINTMRGFSPSRINADKADCDKGHSLSGDNLTIDSRKRRVCMTCKRARQAAYALRQKHLASR